MIASPQSLFGLHPTAPELASYIALLSSVEASRVTPEVKSYHDAVYFNYYPLGLSLLFVPINGYKPSMGLTLGQLSNEDLALDGIDIYNIPKATRPSKTTAKPSELAFSTHPISPLPLKFTKTDTSEPLSLDIARETTGKEFVSRLGEPERKGGGAGPSSGSIGIWCEWTKYGVMVEFGGDEARGPQAWERGKDAVWKVVTLFRIEPHKPWHIDPGHIDPGPKVAYATTFYHVIPHIHQVLQIAHRNTFPSLALSPHPLIANMSVPETLTTLDLSGVYTMNKSLSGDMEQILVLQGIGWLTRKAILYGTVTLYLNHYKDDDGIEHIDIDQTLTGGIPGTSEKRTLWWKEKEHQDHIFGAVIGKSRRVKAEELEEDFLKKGWTQDTLQHGLVESYVESDTPKSGTTWIADQTWGIETVNGERRYTRHLKFTGPKAEDIECRLVYDYTLIKYLYHQTGSHTTSSLPSRNHSMKEGSSSPPESVTLTNLSSPAKLSTSDVVVNETDFEAMIPQTREPWYLRSKKRFAVSHPGLYSRLARYLRYWRGPRPKLDLPDPRPLLDIDWTIKGRRIVFPLEANILRLTRPITAPWIFIIVCAAYIIGFAFFARAQAFLTPAESFIGCTSTYWAANDGCGLNGELCTPFDNSSFEFRCPAQCDIVILQNPRTVGHEQVVFQPLIVGGGDANKTYRGDTFICAAALQAGIIDRNHGGCGALQLVGNFTNFLPFAANGLNSIGFPTVFPLSFRFQESTTLTHCEDLRYPALAFNVIMTCLLFVVFRPRPIVTFWCLVCIGFWHITLFSQPRGSPPPISLAFGTFLPALFICYGFWRLAFRFTLPAFSTASIEAAVLYGGPFWTGVLTNLTTDRLPIDRLTAADLSKRSGAITALVIMILILTVVVINQIRVIRKTGWLPYYLGWYIAGGLAAVVISQLPGLQFRLHHYIIAMVLIPGTAFPTRLSAIYQGFLLGVFLNGAAAWGFDSILQTAQELRRDAPMGSLLPMFLTNSSNWNASIPLENQTLVWDGLSDGWDGFSLLIDDVERYTGTATNISLAGLDPTIPHFFRLAFTLQSQSGDFTMPATLWPNGTWVDPLPGPS
ncbi:hypothetical protein AX16_006445 [Volvariella volvacea WC 439]|nr:hypothetical protein AX16_006445 [Volvariella volvacea WC 439]